MAKDKDGVTKDGGEGVPQERGTGLLWPSLQSQLSPLSTPQLRARLRFVFGDAVPERKGPGRAALIARLVRHYAARRLSEREATEANDVKVQDPGAAARPVQPGQGRSVPAPLTATLLAAAAPSTDLNTFVYLFEGMNHAPK